MSVLLWGRKNETLVENIQQSLRGAHCHNHLMAENSLAMLRRRLLANRLDIEAVVLSPESAEDLEELVELRALLWGLRLILVLPDNGAESAALAHQLTPRFAAPADSNPEDLAAVLMNLLHKENGR